MFEYCRSFLLACVALAVAACQPGWELDSLASSSERDPPRAAAPASAGLENTGDAGPVEAAPVALSALAASEQDPGQHFIEFRARRGYTYGHTLTLFGRMNAAGEMVDVEVAGLTPGAESDITSFVVGHLVPVSAKTGFVAGDLDEDAVLARWRILLSEHEYREVTSFIRQLQDSSPHWHATFYNCNVFASRIARHMGYIAPLPWMLPQQFVFALRAMNSGGGGLEAMAYAPQPSLAQPAVGPFGVGAAGREVAGDTRPVPR